MFMRRLRKDRRGLSLIELVCGMAILSIITTTVGGAMVVASNSYRRGTVETALQQEAQFTVNTIESLVIDATHTVEFDGNNLTITNTDFTYVITYDPGDKTLTYSQHDTADPGVVIASNALLAEHVGGFIVDTSDFNVSRNVGVTLQMITNEGRTFDLAYNITSRNSPNAGPTPVAHASILALDKITLEPNQEYLIPVSVVSSAGTAYVANFELDEGAPPSAVATIETAGVRVKINSTETGGSDGKLRLRLDTVAMNPATGGPLATKFVDVRIRRVNDINISSFVLESGNAYEANAIYRVTADPVGTHFAQDPGQSYDADYVDPDTIQWSVSTSEYFEIVLGGTDKTVHVRLKQDLPAGSTAKLLATSRHATGENKTLTAYSSLAKPAELTRPGGGITLNDILRRGDESSATVTLNLMDLVNEERDVTNNPMEELNGGYTGNVLYRFKSLDGTHTSEDYPKWHKMSEGGLTLPQWNFYCADLAKTYFMKEYTLELCYSFKYNNKDNQLRYYPIGSEDPWFTPDSKYIYNFPILPFSIKFEKCQDGAGNVTVLAPYLTGDSDGIGTKANPLRLRRGGETTFWYDNVTGASNLRAETVNAWTSATVYKLNGGTWTQVNNVEKGIGDRNSDKKSGTFRLNTVNGGLGQGGNGLYKLVMGDVNNVTMGVVETYAEETVPDNGGRGVIYFELY